MCAFVLLASASVNAKVWVQYKIRQADPAALARHHERDWGQIWLQRSQLFCASKVASLVQHFLLPGQLWLHYHPAPGL